MSRGGNPALASESKSESESKSITWLGGCKQREMERNESNWKTNERKKTKTNFDSWSVTTNDIFQVGRPSPLVLITCDRGRKGKREREREKQAGQHLSRGFNALADNALAMEDLRYDSQIYWLLQCGTLARAARGLISHSTPSFPTSPLHLHAPLLLLLLLIPFLLLLLLPTCSYVNLLCRFALISSVLVHWTLSSGTVDSCGRPIHTVVASTSCAKVKRKYNSHTRQAEQTWHWLITWAGEQTKRGRELLLPLP